MGHLLDRARSARSAIGWVLDQVGHPLEKIVHRQIELEDGIGLRQLLGRIVEQIDDERAPKGD